MKILHCVSIAALPLLTTGVAFAQNGHMGNDSMGSFGWMGGYGGMWVPILVVILVAGIVAWAVAKKGK